MSHIKKYLPKSSIVLFSLDSFCVLGLQAIFFKDYYEKLSLYSYLQAFSIIFIAAALQIMLLYSVGCYRRDTLLNPTLEISQVPVAGVLSGILIFLTLHVGYAAIYPTVGVYQRGGECAIITLVIAGVSLGASVISRIAFRIMQRLHWFGRRFQNAADRYFGEASLRHSDIRDHPADFPADPLHRRHGARHR
jgi:uncharacterized membrane protein